MIGIADFSKGLLRLATALRQSVDEATYEVYFDLLNTETNVPEWEAFTRRASLAPPWTRDGKAWFPQVVELVDALREYRGTVPVEAEAIIAYEKTLKASEYTPEGGATWSYRSVRDRVGQIAAEAFLEAGGHHAFATTWNEDKRRERFIAAYRDEARMSPFARVLPADHQKQLEK